MSMHSGRTVRLADGEVLFHEGDAADKMYLVKRGKVSVFRVRDGKRTTLATLNQGEHFGEMALFDKKPRSATVAAIGDVELEVVDKSEFEQLCSTPMVWGILRKMSSRIREVDEALEKLNLEKLDRSDQVRGLVSRHDWFV